jgi:hypothetical protein
MPDGSRRSLTDADNQLLTKETFHALSWGHGGAEMNA